jgi:putative transposase
LFARILTRPAEYSTDILERAKELHPDARPRVISDNGPQSIAKHCKAFIRISGMTHVRTSAQYRLNSAVGCITPKDMLAGRQRKIHAERDRKLEEGRRTVPDEGFCWRKDNGAT